MDALDEVESLSGAARLRQLAERADQVARLVDEANANEWVLDDLDEIRWGLRDLTQLKRAVSTVSGLDDVANELEELASAMQAIRRHRSELQDALDEPLDDEAEALAWYEASP